MPWVGIEDVLRKHGVRYRRMMLRSQKLVTRCPFHSERTPSFVADQGVNEFFCFGCHRSGSAKDLDIALSDRKR